MRHILKFGSALAVSAAVIGSQAAWAGEMPATGNPAQGAQPDAGKLQDIVVTARKRAESVQNTPIAVTALSGPALEHASISTVTQLSEQTPSLITLPPANSSTTTYFVIRGQWGGDIRLTIDPTVAFYVDGVYMPRTVGNDLTDLFDVQRVEILKGNQGTLFGRNTTGGAVNLFYNEPVLGRIEGQVKAHVDNWNGFGLSGAINIPLGEKAALRLVGDGYTNDGYGKGLTMGGDRGSRRYLTGRASLLLQPSENLRILLRGDVTEASGTPVPYKAFQMTLGSSANKEVEAELGLADTADNRIVARDKFLAYGTQHINDDSSNLSPRDKGTIDGASLSLDWDVAEGITFKSISAYRHFTRFTVSDFDGTPFQITQYDFYNMRDTQLSQEFQLSGKSFDNRLDWILGAYYSREKGREGGDNRSTVALSATNPLVTLGIVHNIARGVFAQGTFKLTDTIAVTGGIRYSRDTRGLISGNATLTSCTSLGVTLASLGGAPCLRTLPDVSFDAISYTGGIEYHPTQDIMLYAKTSRGYRSGGQVLSGGSALGPVQATTTFTPFKPEFVTDYEVGFKGEFLDRHVRLNVAAYHSDYSDIQRNLTVLAPGTTNLVTVTQNVAKGKVDGVEVEAAVIPVTGVEISGHGSYTRARFTDYTVGGVDLSATPFFYTPKWQYGGSIAYTVPISPGSVRAQLDYSHQGAYLSSGSLGYSQAGGTANGRITLHLEAPNIDLAVYARNLFDKRFFIQVIDLSSLGYLSGFRNPPRQVGVEISKKF